MIGGTISMQGFELTVGNGEAHVVDADGKPTEEKVQLRILVAKDQQSGLSVHLVFSTAQFEGLIEQLQQASNKIVRPADSFRTFFTRNGKIRT